MALCPGALIAWTVATLTLALPKTGLLGVRETGRLYLADISVPQQLYQRMGLEVGNVFGTDSITLLDPAHTTTAG